MADGEVLAGKALLVGIKEFLRLETMAPWWRAFVQIPAMRKIYVSQERTAHDDDSEAFAAKIGSALGSGNSFQMKRLAFEVYDFAQDMIRLKALAGTSKKFAELFRPFWDKDDSLSGERATCGLKRGLSEAWAKRSRSCRCFSY
jgi:hypothetical protein